MTKGSDFMKKQPSKNEKVFSEITMYLHDIDHRIWSVASQVLAMGLVQKVSAKDMAELLTGSDAKLQDYAKQINEEIKKIEAKNKPVEGQQSAQIPKESEDAEGANDDSEEIYEIES